MGHTLDAAGKPTITNTPLEVDADIQAAITYAEKVGGVVKVTAAERAVLTPDKTKVGWLISETDTGRLYLRTAAAPQGVLVHTPEVVGVFSFSGIYSSDPASPVDLRSKNGRVFMEGRAVSGSAPFVAGTTYMLGSVPEGFRPAREQVFTVSAVSTVLARVLVQTTGAVLFSVSANYTGSLLMGLAPLNWRHA